MKHIKLILISLVCVIATTAKAQESTSQGKFFEDGKSWLWAGYRLKYPGGTEQFFWTETVVGDTIVAGRVAKKILVEDEDEERYVVGWEDNGVIYGYGNPEGTDSICFYPTMNFNLHVGDSTYVKFTSSGNPVFVAEVVNEEVINVCGIERRKLTLQTEDGYIGYWVEGIGANTYDFYLIPVYYSSMGYGYHLVKCFQNGECIFTEDDFLTSTDGIKDVEVSEKDATLSEDAQLYDLSGRKVTGTPRSGIYIKGGRKVLVK